MSALLRAQAFPGGVADAQGQYALLQDAAGRLVAVRLSDGSLLWRSAQPLRPLLLDDTLAIALAAAPAQVLALDLQGREVWRSATLPWPGWAQSDTRWQAASELRAAWLDGDVLLQWTLRQPRPAGAHLRPPGEQPELIQGSAALARGDGALRDLSAQDEALLAQTEAERLASLGEAAALASEDPDLLAQARLHGVRYALRQRREGTGLLLTLQAHAEADAALADATPLWQSPIDALTPRRPLPPQPRR